MTFASRQQNSLTSFIVCILIELNCSFCANNKSTFNTDMRRLTTGIRSEKCVVRRFRRCANAIKCTYTNLGNISHYTSSLYGIAYCCSPAHTFTQNAHTRTHTHTHQMLCCRITTLAFKFLTNFKISNFNKEHMSSLKMI